MRHSGIPRLRIAALSLATVTALGPVLVAPAAHADTGTVCESKLPSQAADTIRLIDQGGPFPYPQDGTVFDNREHVLPSEPSGYYHEYTVKTPGSPDRGARRIVNAQSGTDYYTGDHYKTFDAVDLTC